MLLELCLYVPDFCRADATNHKQQHRGVVINPDAPHRCCDTSKAQPAQPLGQQAGNKAAALNLFQVPVLSLHALTIQIGVKIARVKQTGRFGDCTHKHTGRAELSQASSVSLLIVPHCIDVCVTLWVLAQR